MNEYIIKETLQAKLNRKKAEPANKRYTEGWNDAILMVKSMIHSEKAADVAPVQHGRWAYYDTYIDGITIFRCTCCGDLQSGGDGWGWKKNYCPNCGAKMDGSNDD